MAPGKKSKRERPEIRLRTFPKTKRKELAALAKNHGTNSATYIIMKTVEHINNQPEHLKAWKDEWGEYKEAS